jgi:hypothetical protein
MFKILFNMHMQSILKYAITFYVTNQFTNMLMK